MFTNNIAFAISLGLLALSCSCLLDLGLRRNLYSLSDTRERFDETKNWQIRFFSFRVQFRARIGRSKHVNIILEPLIAREIFTPSSRSFYLSFYHWNIAAHNVNPGSSSLFSLWKSTLRSSSKLSPANKCTSIKACLVVHCVDNLAARALYHVIITVP